MVRMDRKNLAVMAYFGELAGPVDIKPLFGLGGVLIAAMTSEFNDQVTSIALTDVRGALGISHDSGSWIESLYVSAEIIGMAISPWLLVTFTLRRWTLFAIALCGASSVLIPFSPNIEAIYTLRLLQGLAGGMIIPLLMTTAFRVLTPEIRLYGLAVYALTATFTPALASTVAALWTDIVDWRFVFLQTIPLCSVAGVLVWYCLHQDQSRYERFRILDWRGALLLVIGVSALSTMLYQGDRLDWFNSSLICVLALVSAVALPLLLVNEWFHPLPFVNTPPPKGGGFRLRLEAGLIDPSGRFSQTTLKLSSGLYGAFFVKGASRHFGRPLHSILLFDPRREHSSVPTAYFHRRRAQRRSRTALLQRRRRLVLDGREHAGRLPAIGWLAAR